MFYRALGAVFVQLQPHRLWLWLVAQSHFLSGWGSLNRGLWAAVEQNREVCSLPLHGGQAAHTMATGLPINSKVTLGSNGM